jgi:predicted membrane-bound spermidine synthase
MTRSERMLLSLLFFLSGFAGLVYQLIWTRQAFASFGVITPVLSVLISVFMLGLSLGSWAGGRWIGVLVKRTRVPAVHFYAMAEFVIGLGAFGVPWLFGLGERLLLGAGESNSASYLVWSAVILGISVLPWCTCMGVTFPWMMAHIQGRPGATRESFSFLYAANVLGAMCGTLVTALVLVELFGFHDTLRVAASANFFIAGLSFWLGRRQVGLAGTRSVVESAQGMQAGAAGSTAGAVRPVLSAEDGQSCPQQLKGFDSLRKTESAGPSNTSADRNVRAPRARFIKQLLFTTGFCSMAMEVVWTRSFCPVVKTQVYSFALILAAYLGATFLGSVLYRRDVRRASVRATAELVLLLGSASLLPVLLNDTRVVFAESNAPIHPFSALVLILSICPMCALLGYLTPGLVDEFAAGSPAEAGYAYALNVFGCIAGPLVASYVLLPNLQEDLSLVLLALPLLFFAVRSGGEVAARRRFALMVVAVLFLACSLFVSRDYTRTILRTHPEAQSRRDYAASVLSFVRGPAKRLAVNGIGMTGLTPVTKFMVHLPAVFHAGRPESFLIICFGMGTSYRSALSWEAPATAVELVPSVRDAFGFYHADAAQCLANPRGKIIIDDGRRFLRRTREQYDVIVVDPPPPLEAAESSLLYSDEFYVLAKRHLKPGGILQAWILADPFVGPAALRSLTNAFPYVRSFMSFNDMGLHCLASMQPIGVVTEKELVSRMPPPAQNDLLEWSSTNNTAAYFRTVLTNEIPTEKLLQAAPDIHISDDLPYNEYFLLRHLTGR